MTQQFANNATSKLASPLGATDTTLGVTPGDGAKFPTLAGGDWFMATLISSTGAIEIIKVTARSVDTFTTIVRAQEGTEAIAFMAGDRIENRFTAGSITAMVAATTTAQAAANAAQTTANTGVTNAAAAQSTANTANTAAGAAQTDADAAQSTATAAAAAAASLGQQNISSVTNASGALTITYTPAGPLTFRNPTLKNGTPITVANPGPLSITIPQGATLGAPANEPVSLNLTVSHNGGTPVLNVTNLAGGIQLDETNLISPTAISNTSTAPNVIYSASAVAANDTYINVGVVKMPGQTTAGTWTTDPTETQGAGSASQKVFGKNGLIDNTNATSDISLAVGEGCFIDVNAATSAPLHVATGDNQKYEIILSLKGLTGSNGHTLLSPNNTTITNVFYAAGIGADNGAVGAISLYTNAFLLAYEMDASDVFALISTKTISKTVTHLAGGLLGGGSPPIFTGATGFWLGVASSALTRDTTTLWVSLGTLTFPVAVTGRIFIFRKA